jgi:hypothetical protein
MQTLSCLARPFEKKTPFKQLVQKKIFYSIVKNIFYNDRVLLPETFTKYLLIKEIIANNINPLQKNFVNINGATAPLIMLYDFDKINTNQEFFTRSFF